jgi:AraC-like DNA-binding protein
MRAIHETQGHDPALGDYRFARALPAPELRPFVREYVGYLDQAQAVVRRRELPIPNTVVIINLGAAWRMLDPESGRETGVFHSFAAGMSEQFALVEGTGRAHCFHMDLTPLGGYRFFGLPMQAISGQIFELADVLNGGLENLRERLFEARGWAQAFNVLDEFIARRFATGRLVQREIRWAVSELQRTRGATRIGDLCVQLGCSRKHLRQRFLEQVGTPAKQLAQLLRFNHAIERMEALKPNPPERQLAALALSCGYADHAHLSREFRRFSGWSPSEFLSQPSIADGIIVGTD